MTFGRSGRAGAERRLKAIEGSIPKATMFEKLELIVKRDKLKAKLAAGNGQTDAIRAGFVKHAAAYSGRKGIGYAVWREAGVPAAVLRDAGITRRR
jgi:hypothetical protein